MENQLRIRRACGKDTPGVEKLLTQVNLVHHRGRPDLFKAGRKYTESELAALFLDDSRPVFVALDEADTVLGYAFCIMEEIKNDHIRTDVKSLYIDDLCVDEDVRGKRIGKALYDHVREYARAQGCYHITLNVWALNPGAHAFYERMGMRPLKTVMEDML